MTMTTRPRGARVLRRVSERMRAANRANAAKSTGPRTEAGKAVAAANAVTHGLLCEKVRIGEFPDEIREVFEAFRDVILDRLEPAGEVERMLAERVVAGAWRLRRVGHIEGLLTRREMEEINNDRELGLMLTDNGPATDLALAVSRLFTRGCYDQLSRYEARIERGMYKAMHELQRLQARRRGEAVPPPVAMDVQVTGVI